MPAGDIQCFLIQDTGLIERYLRRYADFKQTCLNQPGKYSYHDAMVPLDIVPDDGNPQSWPHDDPRWPTQCACGYQFQPGDERQVFTDSVYERTDTKERFTFRKAPVGSMYYATWYEDIPDRCGPDGKALIVICPGNHAWHVDGKANNCTNPEDKVHRCWVRHGIPPQVSVDKNGLTCNAGAGSISVPGWHGWLRNGVLTTG